MQSITNVGQIDLRCYVGTEVAVNCIKNKLLTAGIISGSKINQPKNMSLSK